MKDDPELEVDDAWTDESTYSHKRKRVVSGNRKPLRILLGIFLVLIIAISILYFISRLRIGGEASILQSRVSTLEQKVTGLERQLADLEGKITTLGPDPALFERVEGLAQKIEALEREKQPTFEQKARPAASSKVPGSIEKQFHTVQKGETLYRISRKYRLSVEELQKLNDLSADQPLRAGQKLLVSPRH
jgi:LysM repeat protein